ncbi:MAG: hypothetical protein LBK62_03085 [Treponema sp.]|nr:hypothetical protein [Treponema sp.]
MKWLPVFFGLLVFAYIPLLAAQEGESPGWDIDTIFDDSPPDDSAEGSGLSRDDSAERTVSTLVKRRFPLDASSESSGEDESLDWDFDAVFDEFPPDNATEENIGDDSDGFMVSSLIRRRGFTFEAAYGFSGGIAPGWNEAPWFSGDRVFTFSPGVKMKASLGLDVQISEVFRVKNVVQFEIPKFSFSLGDFFFDYTLYNLVFVRGGKYGLTWGISPNYHFTNLLARVPPGSPGGESFILKAEIPIGVGGIQVLGQTRANLMGGVIPGREDIGLGGKYNLALRWADIDLGAYYQKGMPPRSFLSIKTTIGRTELYHEWMVAFNFENASQTSAAANIGFARDFFDSRLTVNGELLFNAEENAWWYNPETDIRDAYTSPFIDGLSGALNLLYRIGGWGNPRVFAQLLYAPMEYSAQFVPGFRLNPWSHIEFYAALPMALGSRDGYYYTHTFITDNQNRLRPFSLILLLSLNGSFQYGRYF